MKTALLLGDAASVHDDAAAALALFTPDAIAATNCIGIEWPGQLDYWCTLHPTKALPWPGMAEAVKRRMAAGRNRPETWGHKPSPLERIDRATPDWGGSTGLFAIKCLVVELGFDRVVLAGVPMSADGNHFYETKPWAHAPRYRKGWINHQNEYAHAVRSMSGWTKEFLGEPTREWLAHFPSDEVGHPARPVNEGD